jgi:hypothetical protein
LPIWKHHLDKKRIWQFYFEIILKEISWMVDNEIEGGGKERKKREELKGSLITIYQSIHCGESHYPMP